MAENQPDQFSFKPALSMMLRLENGLRGVFCTGVVLGAISRWLGRWHWLFELTTHFVVQVTILAGIAALWLLIRKHYKLAIIFICLTLTTASEWAPYYIPKSSPLIAEAKDRTLIVASVNVYSRNRNSKALLDWLLEKQVDVVFISEVDPWWSEQIRSWNSVWPHQVIRPRSDNFGLAIISRLPMSQSEVTFLSGDIPAVTCQITSPEGNWSIMGLHPVPPIGSNYSRLRNEQLREVATHIGRLPSPRVVLGDFNSSSCSPYFRDLLTTTGLVDSRPGFGWQPTWPANNLALRIPIDHCLVDSSIRVLSREIGPDFGSDHLPVVCQVCREP